MLEELETGAPGVFVEELALVLLTTMYVDVHFQKPCIGAQ